MHPYFQANVKANLLFIYLDFELDEEKERV